MKLVWHLKCKKCGDEIVKGKCSCGNVVFKPISNQVMGVFVDDLTTCQLVKIWYNGDKVFKRKVWFPLDMGKIEKINFKLKD